MRARRGELGLTLRGLAKNASVSERFLSQLEAGEGNISVVRLEDVAEGLRTTGAELLASASREADQGGPPPIVALVGLRGAGKSSIGARVAQRLSLPFVELDALIVREAQMPLASLFELHGEAHYRTLEREVLRRLLAQGKPMVVATGGSIVTDPETWALLRGRTLTIWLKATSKDHWSRVVKQGDVRPMRDRPRAMNELRALLSNRAPLYEMADAIVPTSGKTLESVVANVLDVARAHARA